MVTERERAIKQMKKLYRDYKSSTEKDHMTFRNSIYFYSIFLNFLKFDSEMEITKEVEEIKQLLADRGIK